MATTYDKASLVLIPSGTKESLVFSQKPTNGDGDFTFSRSTSATRVGPSGYIEKETQNLLLQSNSFDVSANWVNNNTTDTGGQSGYDGTNDAWKLTASSAGSGRRIQQSISYSGVNTFSIYAKAGNLNWIAVTSPSVGAYFDLANGVVGALIGTIIDSNIEDVGSGWYRCSFTANVSWTQIQIYIASANSNVSVSSGDYIYIQDAQLEQGLVARDYIETTTSAVYGGITDNIPRLDYTDSSCPSLLLEPQRTNLVINSERFDASEWNYNNGITKTPNAGTSPEGFENAYLITEDSSLATHRLGQAAWNQNQEATTISVFAKANGRRYIALRNANLAPSSGAWFDLDNGVVGTTESGNTNATIEDYGNGWYRCSITFTPNKGNIYPTIFLADTDINTTYQGDGVSGVYLYGYQIEYGSYATSYIPTYGSAAVTRNSDNSIVTSASNLIGQTEGALFIECEYPRTGSGGSARKLISVNDGSSANLVDIFVNAGANTLTARVRANSGAFGSIGISNNPTGVVKIAYAYKANDYVLYINGTQYGSITTGGTFTFSSELDVIQIGDGEDFNDELGGKCAQALLFKTRLSNEELAALTTI